MALSNTTNLIVATVIFIRNRFFHLFIRNVFMTINGLVIFWVIAHNDIPNHLKCFFDSIIEAGLESYKKHKDKGVILNVPSVWLRSSRLFEGKLYGH